MADPQQPDELPGGVTPPLSWSVHKLREHPAKSLLAGVFLLCFLAFALFAFGPLLTLLAVAVFAAALNTWYLPVRYTLDQQGVTVDKRVYSYTYPWEQFRRWFTTSNGVVLSPFSRRTFLDTFRGVHLLLPPDPGPVLACLARRFDRDGADPAPPALDSREVTDKMDGEEHQP
ncbi:MAG: hypothetical protein R6X14_02680 [bacterium]